MMNANRRLGRAGGVRAACAAALIALLAIPAAADESAAPDSGGAEQNVSAPQATARAMPQPIEVQHWRAHDARGLNVFEPPKQEGVPYKGFKLTWGAAFTQQFQSLHHKNSAVPNVVSGTDLNQLIDIGPGFNNADANLYMDAQLARGIRVELTSYLSSRHHNETWVKHGYLLIDGSPWENPTLDRLMKYLTLRVGHFEINYGDMHFRRSDNGQAMFNPLVGNLIMDAFTTEIGAEAYVRAHGLMGMAAVTGGEVRGQVLKPEQRSPSYMAKLGFDRQVAPRTRVRLTGSGYRTTRSINNTLYSGSRAGSRYFYVLQNVNATESAQAWSGDLQPGFRTKVTAWVVNPFVQCHGLELFGNIEQARGRASTETSQRLWKQYAGEAVYRFLGNQLYVAGRYDFTRGRLAELTPEVTIDRVQAGGGWFITPNIEAKAEVVRQMYMNFPATDIRSGGSFHGLMIEGVVSY